MHGLLTFLGAMIGGWIALKILGACLPAERAPQTRAPFEARENA